MAGNNLEKREPAAGVKRGLIYGGYCGVARVWVRKVQGERIFVAGAWLGDWR